jgi:hypothetical protein
LVTHSTQQDFLIAGLNISTEEIASKMSGTDLNGTPNQNFRSLGLIKPTKKLLKERSCTEPLRVCAHCHAECSDPDALKGWIVLKIMAT